MDIYMILPEKTGSVTTKGYDGASLVNQLHHEVFTHVYQQTGNFQDRSVGAPNFRALNLIKPIDKATKTLLDYYYKGKVIPKVEIHECSVTNEKAQWITRHTLTNVILGRFSQTSSADGHFEEWDLHYSQYQLGYQNLDADYKSSSPAYVGYNLERGESM